MDEIKESYFNETSVPGVATDAGDSLETPVEANRAALNFLDSLDFKILGKTVLTDVLGTVSDTGKEIGELTIKVEETTRDGEICYLVHAQSHGVIDNVPCGTSVTAHIARGLVTLEQTKHEYMKISKNALDKKTVLVKHGEQFMMKMIVTEGEKRHEEDRIYDASSLKGFISEGCNVILQRAMAIKQYVPDSEAEFLSLDSNLNLCTSSYSMLEEKKQSIEGKMVDVMGIGRSILMKCGEMNWTAYFLKDGHMASRCTLGSPVRMQLLRLPRPEDDEEAPATVRRRSHRWEEDMQFWSRFLDRKEELRGDHSTYIQKHPELKALMTDFLQFLLLRKPEDVCSFASNYFDAFAATPVNAKLT